MDGAYVGVRLFLTKMKLNDYKPGIEKCLSPFIKKTKDNALAVSALLTILKIFATKDFQKTFQEQLINGSKS